MKERCAGAWRRQKREKREALEEYKTMMPDIVEEDCWGLNWAWALSGSSSNEGRSRRRKNWIARKKLVKQGKEGNEEEAMKTKNREKIEKERRKMKDLLKVKRREAERKLQIEELRSAKPVPTPDWFVPGNHEVMQSRASANPVRKGFNRTVAKKDEQTGRRFGWAKPALKFIGGAPPLGLGGPDHSSGEKTAAASTSGTDDRASDQPAGGQDALGDNDHSSGEENAGVSPSIQSGSKLKVSKG